jgi:hypothetical protein
MSFNSLRNLTHNGTFRKFLSWTRKHLFEKRLQFHYPDLTIHVSRQAMLSIMGNLIHPGRFTLVTTNVDITRQAVLGRGAQRLVNTPNGGGSSIYSEALSIELLTRLLDVRLTKTETELANKEKGGPLLDYACQLYYPPIRKNISLAVSVTRAMSFNRSYTKEDASLLLIRKLNALQQAASQHDFDRQILHIWTESGRNAATVQKVCRKLDVTSNTIVLLTIVNTHLVFFNDNHHLVKKGKA